VGEHTQEILEELGCERAEIDELRRAGVVTWPDDAYPWRW
jgi:crotonobetainyl-CoA:carnitine CoA-transferase CaiB-like acyl-CoA transferase